MKKQIKEEIEDKIRKELEKGIARNNVLPLDWAMDRIRIILEQAQKEQDEKVEKLKRFIMLNISPICTTEYPCNECLNKEIDKIFKNHSPTEQREKSSEVPNAPEDTHNQIKSEGGCMADYSEEDLRLMKSVREETLEEVEKMIDKWSKKPKFFELDEKTGEKKLCCESLKSKIKEMKE